jgi:hypothetical protein
MALVEGWMAERPGQAGDERGSGGGDQGDVEGDFGGGGWAMRRWLLLPVVYVAAYLRSALVDARDTSSKRRYKTAQGIIRLAELRRWDSLSSPKCEYSVTTVRMAPTAPGVYRVYDGDELVYIGATTRKEEGLRGRLKDHLRGSKSDRELADFIASGEASVEWYACQAPGWLEDYELIEYRESHGQQLPRFNKILSGKSLEWCWW